MGPASLPCLSRDLLVSLKNSNANSLRLIPLCVLFCHTWTLHKTIPRIFFLSLSFTPTPSLRFLKVYYFTKLKYVHEIQFTLILLWWGIFWELKPKTFSLSIECTLVFFRVEKRIFKVEFQWIRPLVFLTFGFYFHTIIQILDSL